MKNVNVVSVTGTKGKTTVVNVLADLLKALTNKKTLHVTTVGHFVDGEQQSSAADSYATWGLVPTVCPGRYLHEFYGAKEPGLAVLEAALGSSGLPGLGYQRHNIGVFLNVFSDHISATGRIKTQADIVLAKKFVFTHIRPGGWAVINGDDELVMQARTYIKKDVQQIVFGIDYDTSDITVPVVTVKHNTVVYVQIGGDEVEVVDLGDVVWTFGGRYQPSVYNLLAVVASIVAYHDGVVPDELGRLLSQTRLDPYGGRLTLMKNNQGVHVIADYAHEEKSLNAVAELARHYTAGDGKVIGVLRLAYDRTEKHIQETATSIADSYDTFVIYDKIDGYYRQPNKKLLSKKFTQEVGKIATSFSDALRLSGRKVECIYREDQAIARAAEIAQPGDVVVHIVNDDIERSINWIKDSFQADFI